MKHLSLLLGSLVIAFSSPTWARKSCADIHAPQIRAVAAVQQPAFLENFPAASREAQIRKAIDEKGLTIVTYNATDLREKKTGPHPQIITARNQKYYEKMFGAQVRVFSGDAPAHPEKIPGVVIHIGNSEVLREFAVGDINLTHLVKAMHKYRRVFDDKWQEYLLARAIDPTVMPTTRNLTDITGRSAKGQRQFDTFRSQTRLALELTLRQPTAENFKNLEDHVQRLVDLSFQYFRNEYPEGSFVKYIREAATGDHGSPINTGMKEADVVSDFIDRIRTVTRQHRGELKNESDEYLEAILGASWGAHDNTKVNLINALLSNPAELIVQQKLQIQKTSDNEMLEVRVNFVRGRGFSGSNRWSVDYVPDKIKAAIKFVNDFFDKGPPELRQLAGGADVVFLKDGTMKFIEFNFGSESGYMDVRGSPIEANQFFSNLIGKQTPLIQQLESVHRGGLPAMLEFFRKQEIMSESVKNEDQTLEDLIYIDAFMYFRDRKLEDLQRAGRLNEASRVVAELKQVLLLERARLGNRPDVLEKWEAVIRATELVR